VVRVVFPKSNDCVPIQDVNHFLLFIARLLHECSKLQVTIQPSDFVAMFP
jgi:hypothetical protein